MPTLTVGQRVKHPASTPPNQNGGLARYWRSLVAVSAVRPDRPGQVHCPIVQLVFFKDSGFLGFGQQSRKYSQNLTFHSKCVVPV